MARPKGTSRVAGSGQSSGGGVYVEPHYPSLRERKPFMYWTVIIAVVAMVLTTVGSVALAFV